MRELISRLAVNFDWESWPTMVGCQTNSRLWRNGERRGAWRCYCTRWGSTDEAMSLGRRKQHPMARKNSADPPRLSPFQKTCPGRPSFPLVSPAVLLVGRVLAPRPRVPRSGGSPREDNFEGGPGQWRLEYKDLRAISIA